MLVVPRSNVDALAASLEDFLLAPARARSQTLDLVAKHFSPGAVHAAYDAVYRRAIGEK